MVDFAIGRYGDSDYRLVKWDGSTQTEIGPDGAKDPSSGWDDSPTLRDVVDAMMDYHGTGNQPFSSREGTKDSIQIGDKWPLPEHDREAGHKYPWNR